MGASAGARPAGLVALLPAAAVLPAAVPAVVLPRMALGAWLRRSRRSLGTRARASTVPGLALGAWLRWCRWPLGARAPLVARSWRGSSEVVPRGPIPRPSTERR